MDKDAEQLPPNFSLVTPSAAGTREEEEQV